MYIGICRPGEDELEKVEMAFDSETDEGKQDFFEKMVNYVTGSKDGKITNMGYLPSPLTKITAFVNFDQYDPNTKYNMNFFGNPIYGNIVFTGVDINTEDGKIIMLDEKSFKEVNSFIMKFKKFEKDQGIYDHINSLDKEKFLTEFVKEQNNVLEESTKINSSAQIAKETIPENLQEEYDSLSEEQKNAFKDQ